MNNLLRNMSVQIVDDVKAPRRVLRKLLSEIGITTVTEAENGAEAIASMKERMPTLVICDFHLGDMTGVDILKRVRAGESSAQVPFILISSDVGPNDAQLAKEAGVSGYLLKPFSLQNLLSILAFALEDVNDSSPIPSKS